MRWSPDGASTFDADDQENSIIGNVNMTYKDVFAGSELANALHTGIIRSSVNLDLLIQFLAKNTDSRTRAAVVLERLACVS